MSIFGHYRSQPLGMAQDIQTDAILPLADRSMHHTNQYLDKATAARILGPNGAGKSTTLRMRLLGLTRPTSGEISVAGHHVAQLNSPVRVRTEGCHPLFQDVQNRGIG